MYDIYIKYKIVHLKPNNFQYNRFLMRVKKETKKWRTLCFEEKYCLRILKNETNDRLVGDDCYSNLVK